MPQNQKAGSGHNISSARNGAGPAAPARPSDDVVIKRSVSIAGHPTSVSLEEPFWAALRMIAAERNLALAALIAEIDEARTNSGLSSAIRLHVLAHYQALAAQNGAG